MILCALALAGMFGRTPQAIHLEAGFRWSADRTIRFLSKSAEIDIQNDDHFEYAVESTDHRLAVRVRRHLVGTHLSDGAFIAAAQGEPEQWTLSMSEKGQLTPDKQPSDELEQILSQLVVATWNGPQSSTKQSSIQVKSLSPGREQISYVESSVRSHAKIEGIATLDPETHAPLSISLTGEHVQMPGGPDLVTIKVEYKAKREKS